MRLEDGAEEFARTVGFRRFLALVVATGGAGVDVAGDEYVFHDEVADLGGKGGIAEDFFGRRSWWWSHCLHWLICRVRETHVRSN